jgi:nucleoid-associated protein YgaU
MDRYNNRDLILNKDGQYQSLFDKRGIKHIRHYTTPELNYPDEKQMQRLKLIPYVWKRGDKLYNVADEYYGVAKLWWVVAFFNKKSTDHSIKIGETIFIPTPLEEILAIFGV